MDGMLSQEEINALLNDVSSADGAQSQEEIDALLGSGSAKGAELSDEEKDAVGEISNISMGTAATTLSTLLNQKVVITTPNVSYAVWNDITNAYDRPCVFIQISYIDGLDGNNVLIMKESDVKIITDLMMGGDGSNTSGELSELHLSAISEAMNQMMGSAATSISSMLEKKVDISPPVATLVDLNDTISEEDLSQFLKGSFIKVSFKLVIGNLIDSELMQLYPFEFAKDLYRKFIESSEDTASIPKPSENQAAQPTPAPAPYSTTQQATPPPVSLQGGMQQQMPYGMPMQQMPYGMPMQQDINVQPVQFQPFTNNITPVVQPENINLLMDVPLEVTVELGRTSKSIKEILDFSPGTIIELDKLAGEPVDVLVNGKFVAKGEVMVIEDCFGIKVTEIVH